MAGKSNIEWTEHTWNPIVGCSILTPGCTNCYAMKMAARIEAMNEVLVHKSAAQATHYAGTTKKVKGRAVWTGKLALAPVDILLQPLKRKKPTTYFVNSMGDLFHEDAPDEWIERVFDVMRDSPQHTFQVLTKRAARMKAFVTERFAREAGRAADNQILGPWPVPVLPNVWLGVSTERQQEADERIPHLLTTPAAVRFISAEPLLGSIDLKSLCGGTLDALRGHDFEAIGDIRDAGDLSKTQHPPGLDWVIVGGESGSGAHPMHPDWARSLRDQCEAAGVPMFFKQWGEWSSPCDSINVSREHALCGVMAAPPHIEKNWPRALDFLQKTKNVEGAFVVARVGKSRAGRLLDGKEHNAMPKVMA